MKTNGQFIKGSTPWNKGKKMTDSCREANRNGHLGKKTGKDNPNWKDDKVGYHALHDWVERYLGKPDTCEYCGKSGLSGKNIHWANKSHKYKRKLNDWIRLCVNCHLKYDNNNISEYVKRNPLFFNRWAGEWERII